VGILTKKKPSPTGRGLFEKKNLMDNKSFGSAF